jgi:hypothetical protein
LLIRKKENFREEEIITIEDYNQTIHLKPNYVQAYNNRENTYLNQSNKELGCRDAQKKCELGNCRTLEATKDRSSCR